MNTGDNAPTAELREGLVHVAPFLLSAARGLLDEPPDYAIYRCADGARRALELVELTVRQTATCPRSGPHSTTC